MRTETHIDIPLVELEDHNVLEAWLDPGSLCAILSIHPGTLRRWRRQGVVPASSTITLGAGVYRYSLSRVLAALADR